MLYRYSQENYGVTIIENRKIIARFDLDTENMCNVWPTTTVDYVNGEDPTKEKFTQYLNDNVLSVVGAEEYTFTFGGPDDVQDKLFKKIYGQRQNSIVDREYYCAWQDRSLVPKRIDSDLLRSICIFLRCK